jgi:hypothetical protein
VSVDFGKPLRSNKQMAKLFMLASSSGRQYIKGRDAEQLILATREGHVQLVLRNPVDSHTDKVKDATLQQLYEQLPTTPVKAIKPRLKPAVLPMPDTPEIKICQGNEVYTFECKDGGQCTPETKAH